MSANGKCPVGHSAGDMPQEPAQSREGVCPVAHAPKAAEPPAVQESGGRCPFGYDQKASSKLSPLHCALCQSLYYKPANVTDCKHCFCKACISRFQDCPLCGIDISGVAEYPEMADKVNSFIEAHSRKAAALQPSGGDPVQGAELAASAPEDRSNDSATFLLDIGLRSLAGGNAEAALDRLGACAEHLRHSHAEHAGEQLGAVLGSQGDCCRQLGRLQEAQVLYRESVDVLQGSHISLAGQQAASVSLNKLGDILYLQGDVHGARDQYASGLAARRRILQQAEEGGSGQGRQAGSGSETQPSPDSVRLDVATSLGKLADAEQAVGQHSEAEGYLEEARQLVQQLQGSISSLAKPQQDKLKALVAFLGIPQSEAASAVPNGH